MKIWVRDLERGIKTRTSSLDGFAFPSAWSHDGSDLAVMNDNPADRASDEQTVFLAADESGPARQPYPGLLVAFSLGWKRTALITDPRGGSAQLSTTDLTERIVIGNAAVIAGSFFPFIEPGR